MTHDELLMKLWEKRNSLCDHLDIHFALSDVVELHKPKEYKVAGTFADGLVQTGCVCGGWSYPCPTIQAIESALQ